MRLPSLYWARLAPDEGNGGGAPNSNAPPPGEPAKPTAEDLEKKKAELEAQIKALEEKVSRGEQRGMSESTGHALLEEIRDLKKELAEVKATKGGSRSWFGF